MENEKELQDSNPEEEQDLNLEEESNDELVKAKDYAKNQKIRAEKAEKELKALKSKQKESETPKKEDNKSNEPDYAKLAFLEQRNIKHPDDQKLVSEEAKRLKLPLTDVLNMEHIKNKLKDSADQREAMDGSPSGKGKSGGSTVQDVDYHLAKGTTPDDLELAEKVINARMKKDSDKGMFSDDLYTG